MFINNYLFLSFPWHNFVSNNTLKYIAVITIQVPQHLASSRALCVSQLSCLGQHTFHASYTNLPVHGYRSTRIVPSPTLQAVVLEISECKIDNMLYKTHHNDLESINLADQPPNICAGLNKNLELNLWLNKSGVSISMTTYLWLVWSSWQHCCSHCSWWPQYWQFVSCCRAHWL